MSYQAWSVVAGEIPTSTKWNILGNNDASFNDGSGLSFTTNNVVPANALATSAIKLGYAEITSPFSSTSVATYVDVTGLSVTVTVPAGGRDLKITAMCPSIKTTAAAGAGLTVAVRESTTILAQITVNEPASAFNIAVTPIARVAAPSAGSHTYKMSIAQSNAGTMTFEAGTSASTADWSSGFILVEAI